MSDEAKAFVAVGQSFAASQTVRKRSARAPSLRGRTAEISGMPVPRQ